MLKVVKKSNNLIQVIDTVDNIVEEVDENTLKGLKNLGVEIVGLSDRGVSVAKDLVSLSRKAAKSKLLGIKLEELKILDDDSGLFNDILNNTVEAGVRYKDLGVLEVKHTQINKDVVFYEYKMSARKRNLVKASRPSIRKSVDADGRNASYILVTRLNDEVVGLNLINITGDKTRRVLNQYLGVIKTNVYSSSLVTTTQGTGGVIRYDLDELCYGVCDISSGECKFYSTLSHTEVEPKKSYISREEHLKIHKLLKA